MLKTRVYGLMAEFRTAEQLLEAAHRTHAAGYTRVDAFSPFPIEGLAEAIGFRNTKLPLVVLIGGIVGAISGYSLQYYAAVVSGRAPTSLHVEPPDCFSILSRKPFGST